MTLIDRSFREKIVLVGVAGPATTPEMADASLDELEQLVDTAGADVEARVVQRRDAPDPAYYVGRGKVDELRAVALETDCDTVVFDDELTPAQQFNLEKLLGRTAIDRTAVILDIFAQNAHSPEGKAQVELALLNYRLPRLRGMGKRLSQQAGGIGTRGPGETKSEVDRRRVTRRIHRLERELQDRRVHRDTRQKARRKSGLPQVALVGYTNAGKSTLLNTLTDAGVLAEDRLFATLDATTRRLDLPDDGSVLLADTVGFIRKLPHHLVEAFATTLEGVADADLIVHLVDASAEDPDGQRDTVRRILDRIGAAEVPELLVFNKADRTPEAARLAAAEPGSLAVSAATGEGVEALLAAIGDRTRSASVVLDLLVPFERGDVMADAHRAGSVLEERAGEAGMHLTTRLPERDRGRFEPFVIS
ncbi:MAG: GTPase HflX [Actinomycetota bacterium]